MFRPRGKGPVYKLDRSRKALMIEAVLASHLGRPVKGLRMLDIGCGNGDISQHFGRQNEQYGVDIEDRRRADNRAFRFCVVDSVRLPFGDAVFDAVISHHVIEHVRDQRGHLAEMRRTLKPDAVAYLATPNRSSPLMQGHSGNDLVLRYPEMEPLFKEMGFRVKEYSVDVVKRPGVFHNEIDAPSLLPTFLLRSLRFLYPTHVFVLTPRS